jgi:hypothetical protein
VQNYAALERLVHPIRDAAEFAGARSVTYCNLRKHLCRQMHRHSKTFWEFSEEEWTETVALSKHATKRCAFVVGYLLGGISGARLLTLDHKPTVTARKALGEEAVEEALSWLRRATEGWGYERRGGGLERLEAALCRALLLRGSPRPQEVNDEAIEVLLEGSRSAQLRKTVRLLSRVLYAMGVPVWPIPDPRDGKTAPRTAGLSGDHISAEWIQWADRWRDASTQESREHTHMYLLKIGRWLAHSHPDIISPEHWDQQLAVEYVAAVDRMKTGDWGSEWARLNPHRAGKPSMPRSKDHQLRAARAFFRDLQEWGWIEVRFDPALPAYPALHQGSHRPGPQDHRRRHLGQAGRRGAQPHRKRPPPRLSLPCTTPPGAGRRLAVRRAARKRDRAA